MCKTISFNRITCARNEPIIIYGASVYGELAYVALKQMGYFNLFDMIEMLKMDFPKD